MERTKDEQKKVSYVVQQVRGDCIIRYQTTMGNNKGIEKKLECLEVGRKNTYQGQITDTMTRKIKKRVTVWYNSILEHNNKSTVKGYRDRKRLIFVTLTLSASQRHDDVTIKRKILKPFLRILREKHGFENYIWKAEKQQNGNIHFHLIADRYIKKELLTETWNKCQNALNYIDRFESKFECRDAPSTHVRVVKSGKMAIHYVSKYIGKGTGEKSIEGAVCYTSNSLINLDYYKYDESGDETKKFDELEKEGKVKRIVSDVFEIIVPINCTVNDILTSVNKSQLQAYYKKVSQYLYEGIEFDNMRKDKKKVPENEKCEISKVFIRKREPAQTKLNLFDSVEFEQKTYRKHYEII
ncbi:MAG: hypothetical protein PF436_01965 [Prolixibacteraceae bacterium]|nr:hypothetical protein [Prolixibacteraceae bacterium]